MRCKLDAKMTPAAFDAFKGQVAGALQGVEGMGWFAQIVALTRCPQSWLDTFAGRGLSALALAGIDVELSGFTEVNGDLCLAFYAFPFPAGIEKVRGAIYLTHYQHAHTVPSFIARPLARAIIV